MTEKIYLQKSEKTIKKNKKTNEKVGKKERNTKKRKKIVHVIVKFEKKYYNLE